MPVDVSFPGPNYSLVSYERISGKVEETFSLSKAKTVNS